MAAETEEMCARRHHQRALFDGVADRYRASRREYPPESVQFIIDAAQLGPGCAVLEVGCGTGQLTGQLAAHGPAVTAIDIGASMITRPGSISTGRQSRFESTPSSSSTRQTRHST